MINIINNFPLALLAYLIIFIGVLLSIVYTFGVVWRVEKKLDKSFKLFLAAIFSFFFSEIASLFEFGTRPWVAILSLALRALFVILFLAGILEMRSMLCRMDGEKKDRDEI